MRSRRGNKAEIEKRTERAARKGGVFIGVPGMGTLCILRKGRKTMLIPAITILQPWATLILRGYKTYETRTWKPPRKFLGQRIALHTAKSDYFIRRTDDYGYEFLTGALYRLADELRIISCGYGKQELKTGYLYSESEFPLGKVFATATLARCWDVTRNGCDDKGNAIPAATIQSVDENGQSEERLVKYNTHEYVFGNFTQYRSDSPYRRTFAWELADVRPLPEPIPARGRPGFWYWDDGAER